MARCSINSHTILVSRMQVSAMLSLSSTVYVCHTTGVHAGFSASTLNRNRNRNHNHMQVKFTMWAGDRKQVFYNLAMVQLYIKHNFEYSLYTTIGWLLTTIILQQSTHQCCKGIPEMNSTQLQEINSGALNKYFYAPAIQRCLSIVSYVSHTLPDSWLFPQEIKFTIFNKYYLNHSCQFV